jgi:hypothetical protein
MCRNSFSRLPDDWHNSYFSKGKTMDDKNKKPLIDKEEVQQNPDKKIDQDFEGYPHAPSKEHLIQPKTGNEKKTAAVNVKDGEKKDYPPKDLDQQDSDGSANAFDDK